MGSKPEFRQAGRQRKRKRSERPTSLRLLEGLRRRHAHSRVGRSSDPILDLLFLSTISWRFQFCNIDCNIDFMEVIKNPLKINSFSCQHCHVIYTRQFLNIRKIAWNNHKKTIIHSMDIASQVL